MSAAPTRVLLAARHCSADTHPVVALAVEELAQSEVSELREEGGRRLLGARKCGAKHALVWLVSKRFASPELASFP